MQIWVPHQGQIIRLTDDWTVELDWRKENLRLFEFFNLTGHKTVKKHRYEIVNGRYTRVEYDGKALAFNPIFKDNDGEYAPVDVTFEKDTQFSISVIHASRWYFNGLEMKVQKSPHKKLVGRRFVVSKDPLSTGDFEIVEP